MKEIRTEIAIRARPERVWDVFTAFGNYPKWNPFIASLTGDVAAGKVIRILLTPPGGRPMKFSPKVLRFEEKKELRWLGRLLVPGLFDGEHVFEIEDRGDGTAVFVQREIFRGILVPLFGKMLDGATRSGFEAMNEKLKELAEAGQALSV